MEPSNEDISRALPIHRYDSTSGWTSDNDPMAGETLITLVCNGKVIQTLPCLPRNVKELVVGRLFLSGTISSANEVADLHYENMKASVVLAHEHAPPVSPAEPEPLRPPFPAIDPSLVLKASQALKDGSPLFRETGGVHSVTLWSSEGDPVVTLEDVGRHNAFDKVCGYCLLNGIETRHCFLACAGRISGSIVRKAWLLGVPLLVSCSAVTSLAVETAIGGNIGLVGFTRGTRFNVYHGKDRIG